MNEEAKALVAEMKDFGTVHSGGPSARHAQKILALVDLVEKQAALIASQNERIASQSEALTKVAEKQSS